MMQKIDERRINAYMSAVVRMIDPGRAAMADASPYVVTAGTPLDMARMASFGGTANAIDADLVHLEFAPGTEDGGPVNVMTAAQRGNVLFVKRQCRFWLDPRGTPFLVARCGGKTAVHSFGPDGMDGRPGRPKGSLENGYARARRRLAILAAEALAEASGDGQAAA